MSGLDRTVRRLSGFGGSSRADAHVARPGSPDAVAEAFAWAAERGRKVALRGSGRSYGDAAYLPEEIVLDLRDLDRCEVDPETGVASCGAGATIGDLWRTALPLGWWPPVVPGTMFPTLGGALAMNIHGKNAYRAGTLGEHALQLDAVAGDGRRLNWTPDDGAFRAVVSSAGLLAAIVGARIQLKPVASGDLDVLPVSCRNWDGQFEQFEQQAADADYMVAWIDGFAAGSSAGRGLFHAAWHRSQSEPDTLDPRHQALPDRMLGVLPKSQAWRALRMLSHRAGMRLLNAAKYAGSRWIGNRRLHRQSLVAFSFLLDYVPGWERSYGPGGFVQYQSFVPAAAAPRVFARQIELQQEAGLPNYLGVLKRHRPDSFLLGHGLDGYSFAQDFPAHPSLRADLEALARRMTELVLDAGGRFYLAKDSLLLPAEYRASVGGAIEELRRWKKELDPRGVLDSSLARRLQLLEDS